MNPEPIRGQAKPHLRIVPHQGVGPIRFGMKRDEARAAMSDLGLALSSSNNDLDFFGEESAVQVEYQDGSVSFIGVSCGVRFDVSIDEVDPFDIPAPALFRLLAKCDGAEDARFDECQHCFRNSIVTLYEADDQYDRKGGRRRVIWGQIGVGDARYLAAIDTIASGAAEP